MSGILPLIIALKKDKRGIAIASWISCVIAGLLGGLLLAIPIALIFIVIVVCLKKPASQFESNCINPAIRDSEISLSHASITERECGQNDESSIQISKHAKIGNHRVISNWLLLSLLVTILISIFLIHFSNNPIKTRADMSIIPVDDLVTSTPQRDLSTPSSRLVGHWVRIDNSGEIYYGPIEPSLKIGNYRLYNESSGILGPPFQFKVLFEEPAGQKLIIRVFKNQELLELEATTGYDFSKSDILCCISKNGQSMSQEYTSMGIRRLDLYRYVNDITRK